MNELSFFLQIIVLFVSILAIGSYFISYRDATKKASTFAKEVEQLKDGDVSFELINSLERNALNDFFPLKIPDEPIKKVELIGEVNIHSLSFSSNEGSSIVSIGGVNIQVPHTLPIEKIIQALGDSASINTAMVEEKFYFLSVGDFSLVSEFKSKKLNKETLSAIENGKEGKIENLPLELLKNRSATHKERLYFDPLITGKRYAILMIILFTITPLIIEDMHSYLAWLGSYSVILCCGFGLWYRSRKRDRKTFQITKVVGQFNEINFQNDECYAKVIDEDGVGEIKFSLPRLWENKLDLVALNQEVTFEILNGSSDIVSIGKKHSLNNDFIIEPTNKHFFWIAITLFAMLLNTVAHTNLQSAKLALDMFTVSSIKAVNSIDDWESISRTGEQIYTNTLHRKCILSEQNDTESEIEWSSYCKKFNVFDESQNIDLLESISEELDALSNTQRLVYFEMMNSNAYHKYHSRLFYAGQVRKAKRRKDIFQYNFLTLHRWAKWLDDNNINDVKFKDKIVDMWNEIDLSRQCTENCWEKIITYQQAKDSRLLNAYITKHNLYLFSRVKQEFFEQKIDSILSTLSRIYLSNEANPNKKIQVNLIVSDTPDNAWKDLLDSHSLLSSHFQNGMLERGGEFIKLIHDSVFSIQEMQEENIAYGVVSSISLTGDTKVIEIDLTMDKVTYRLHLAKILIIIMAMFGLSVILAFFFKKRTKHENNNIDD